MDQKMRSPLLLSPCLGKLGKARKMRSLLHPFPYLEKNGKVRKMRSPPRLSPCPGKLGKDRKIKSQLHPFPYPGRRGKVRWRSIPSLCPPRQNPEDYQEIWIAEDRKRPPAWMARVICPEVWTACPVDQKVYPET
jgi:hypothetical protein